MTGKYCCVCGNSQSKDPNASFHRFPKDQRRRAVWLKVFDMKEEDVKPSHRVCSRHFPGADSTKDPESTLGKRFASPIKKGPRAKRAKSRESNKQLRELYGSPISPTPSTSRSATPYSVPNPAENPPLTVEVGEPLHSDYNVHEVSLPDNDASSQTFVQPQSHSQDEILANTALLARIEYLESKVKNLEAKHVSTKSYFRIEQVKSDDRLVRFYTGFITYSVFLAFFKFLGPVVDELNYWGSKKRFRKRKRPRKLDPENQLFMTLVKLRLNLKTKDLAFRFGVSATQVSRYITTWICFLYHHLSELDWMPSVEQVSGTLPCVFKEKFPTTFAIIDGSEIFLETPTDLYMQSSTWSQYKHQNTAKFLVGCTPNGAISYISPLYVGSISDVELTRVCGFLNKLEDKPGVSIMADRGFTVKDMLEKLGISLNIPPFMEGRAQLPSEEVETGRRIASLRIHVERAIGRIKTYRILTSTLPISMARLSNQIVCVCAFLSNFHPALVPLPPKDLTDSEADADEYFEQLNETDTEEDESESDNEFAFESDDDRDD